MKIIHKVAGLAIKDNAVFLVKKYNTDIWTSLGGRPEEGESEEETLVREVKEEVGCDMRVIKKLGDFEAKAAHDDAIVRLSTYLIELIGEPRITDGELETCAYITRYWKDKGVQLTAVFTEQVIPHCVREGILVW